MGAAKKTSGIATRRAGDPVRVWNVHAEQESKRFEGNPRSFVAKPRTNRPIGAEGSREMSRKCAEWAKLVAAAALKLHLQGPT